MDKKTFEDLCKNKYVLLDGACGSNLVNAGMPAGVCPEKWIVDHKDIITKLLSEYVDSGSDIIYAPTFTANSVKLNEYGLMDSEEEIITSLVSYAKEVVHKSGRKVYIAGDISMTGKQLKPIGDFDFEDLVNVYKTQIKYLVKAGVDLLVVETMLSLNECRAALIAAKETCDLPVMVTLSFNDDHKTIYGTDAKTAAVCLSALGASAIGANCSGGPASLLKVVRDMALCTNTPIIAKPNAGKPLLDKDNKTVYSLNPDEFVNEMMLLTDAGATILGGCCGTTPEYIKCLKSALDGREFKPVSSVITSSFLTSERSTYEFSYDSSFAIVGERINPTGKKALSSALKDHDLSIVTDFAEEQTEMGAKILDVNVGMPGIDEESLLCDVIDAVTLVSNLPVSIDSSNINALEKALRRYPGRALVNSVSLEKEKFERLIPIIKKYGAMFILLPLSDEGLPKTLDEKISIINTIMNRANECGLSKKDVIVDALVTTVGVDSKAGLKALETIRYCKENGYSSICGLSNISHGMPQRAVINKAFLNIAIKEGLTMAIANPCQELFVLNSKAADLIAGKENATEEYIESAALYADPDKKPQVFSPDMNTEDKIKACVIKGNKKETENNINIALKEGISAEDIFNRDLFPAINEVGELYDKGKYFIPQLIASAEAMKSGVDVLTPYLKKDASKDCKGIIVIATVEGDIHDIGKNLVALMLSNNGFKVIDCGKDVTKEIIVAEALKYNADIIALSALMTTTMVKMKDVIDYSKKMGCKSKIMIGGAVITKEYADEIGADGYSKDASEAVKVANTLLK